MGADRPRGHCYHAGVHLGRLLALRLTEPRTHGILMLDEDLARPAQYRQPAGLPRARTTAPRP
jgi:hypothetical protein